MDKIKIKMWSVQTTGGQIINDQEPQETFVVFNSAERAELAQKRGFTWDSDANYYLTKTAARKAIAWALSN